MRHLSGTTWAHTRAIAPLAAASQWFVDAGADVSVSWSTHSARQFGEGPISSLIDQFDLICFDHPHVGHAANGGLFIPADEFLSQAELAERERASTGLSFESYRFGGRQWGIPVDAACTMSALSPSKFDAMRTDVPVDLEDVLRLAADRPGKVLQPFSRMTTTALFFSISVSLSDCGPQRLHAHTFGDSLEILQKLFSVTQSGHGFKLGSIDAMRLLMTESSETAYVPFTYPYSCFGRTDIIPNALKFESHPSLDGTRLWHGVLGGAGIAVSAKSASPRQAFDLLRWLTSTECQTVFFGLCLGQPADRFAWSECPADSLTRGFFSNGLRLMDCAWLRPTDLEFGPIQSQLAEELHRYLAGACGHGQTRQTVTKLLDRYVQ